MFIEELKRAFFAGRTSQNCQKWSSDHNPAHRSHGWYNRVQNRDKMVLRREYEQFFRCSSKTHAAIKRIETKAYDVGTVRDIPQRPMPRSSGLKLAWDLNFERAGELPKDPCRDQAD